MKNYLPRTLFNEEHEMFREAVRGFVETEIRPNVERWHDQGYVDREMFKKAGDMGLLGMEVDEQWGGGGMNDYRFNAVLTEELAKADSGSIIVGIQTINDLVIPYLQRFANDEQKERFLKPLCSGEKIAAIAMTEPEAGADLAGIRTLARDNGDGSFTVNGAKTFISNGVQADFTIIVAITDPEKGRAGISLLIVEDGMEGYTKTGPLKKVGLKSQDTAELSFENVQVPAENLLGERGAGFGYLRHNLAQERLSIAVGSVATSRRAFDLVYQHSQDRKTFGNRLVDHQAYRWELAKMVQGLQAAQSFVDACIEAKVKGELDETTAAMAKYHTTELQIEVVNQALQMHGGYGFMMEYPIATHYLDSRVQPIYGGPNEIMLEIISRKLAKGE
ncbi:acyl-CoA dehydrogenase family protein [Corynebacterium urealyticum]|uniref:Acyl-[acyl-carrier-protein] dehydrogenase MbtN n=2 Tax=Corynebacterium TaxID=1716 RepID=B1VFM7_CORU7|nr:MULTISPECIES: acyl-CoA dehydrogenase family protein [Corynebacterium]HJD49231.1 acyl-CoA dehydrogenase family protein [Candidatus Corynebacterium intestinavium]AGE36192.1 acyl-CoA dehydrogenase [Corynebacterium urealyticum DSM 7111]MDK7134644.1 acyl-CoA dehydrogenase family protein [Corynebacterium sp. UMB4614]QQB07864.1 acyl-CoA dehydrogenase family protein [Corynebacterium urealyticum]QQC41948.1 acyl-CoA dehydrogenase family protein [Corynebacterium urealyticum]